MIIAEWNANKGAVEQTSQWLSTTHPAVIKDRPSNFTVVERLLQLVMLQIFLMSNYIGIEPAYLEPHNNFLRSINHMREYSRRQNMSFKSFMGETLLPVLSLLAKRTEVALAAMPALGAVGRGRQI